jgi:hypothetical protein
MKHKAEKNGYDGCKGYILNRLNPDGMTGEPEPFIAV